MNDPLASEIATKAREETHTNLAIAEHYARLARGHLEIGDDIVALLDIERFVHHARAATRNFRDVRRLMIERDKDLNQANYCPVKEAAR